MISSSPFFILPNRLIQGRTSLENDNKAAPEFVDLLLWVLLACAKRWKGILISAFIAVFVTSIIVVYVLDERFESVAVVLPPKSSKGAAFEGLEALGKNLGSLGLAGGFFSSSEEETDIMLTVLESYDFQRSVINRFGLDTVYEFEKGKPYFEADLLKKYRKEFKAETNDNTSFLEISMRDANPARAKAVVDTVLKMLDSAYVSIKVNQASKSRNFFEDRIRINKKTMDSLKAELQAFQTKNSVLDPKMQLEASVKQLLEMEQQKESAYMRWQSECQVNGCDGSTAKKLKAQYRNIADTYEQLKKKGSSSGASINLRSAPALLREYEELLNEVRIQEAINTYLRQMYEQSLLEEMDKVGRFEVIAKPWLNNKRVSPPRTAVVSSVLMIDLIFAVLICCFLEMYLNDKQRGGSRYRLLANIFGQLPVLKRLV